MFIGWLPLHPTALSLQSWNIMMALACIALVMALVPFVPVDIMIL